jgi:very-short-patch-repair endonuclease
MKHGFAKDLRHHQTDVERKLWYELRNRQLARFKFRRQQPIGPYVVDFVCFRKWLVIELDGSQHSLPENVEADAARTRFLESQGFRVKRYTNDLLINDMDAVISDIATLLGAPGEAPRSPQTALFFVTGARGKWLYRKR